MDAQHISLGKKGEEIAAKFLQNIGFKIIERNFKKKHGDIDIVALDGKILVFIEVKTRTSQYYGLPIESITPWKVKMLIKSAQLYSIIHPQYGQSIRIDVVTIDFSENKQIPKIEHIKSITS